MGAFVVGVLLALRAIRRNGLRASLTVLGILIGVAAVVTVTALGAGARESVGSQIASLGSNMLIIIPQDSNASGARSATGARAKLTEDDGRAIGREAVSVAAYAPTLRSRSWRPTARRSGRGWPGSRVRSRLPTRPVRRGSAWPGSSGSAGFAAWSRPRARSPGRLVIG